MTEITDNTLSLYFGLHEGKKADLEIVSKAAIEWVNSVRLAAKMIEPTLEVRVEIVSAHEGSLSLNTIFDWGETQLEKLENVKHPKMLGLAFALAIFLAVDLGPASEYWLGEPDKLELNKEDRELLNDLLEKISKSEEVRKHNRRFYEAISNDRAVKSVGVCEKPYSDPVFSVPSSQFGERSGLWEPEIEIKERTAERNSDVILETADLSTVDRKWRFFDVQTGTPFTAKMRDKEFIQSLENGEIEENLRTGIKMEIYIKFKERFEDGHWKSVPTTIEVMKVTLT